MDTYRLNLSTQSAGGVGGGGSRRRLLPAARAERAGPRAGDRDGPGRLRHGRERRIGIPTGLRFFSLMMLTLGLPVALLLWQAARGLRAPPGAGYV